MKKLIALIAVLTVLIVHSLPSDNALSRTLNNITLYSQLPAELKHADIRTLDCYSDLIRLISAYSIHHEIWYSDSNTTQKSLVPGLNSRELAINSIRTVTVKMRRISLLFLDNNQIRLQIKMKNGLIQAISQNKIRTPFFYSDFLN